LAQIDPRLAPRWDREPGSYTLSWYFATTQAYGPHGCNQVSKTGIHLEQWRLGSHTIAGNLFWDSGGLGTQK